MNRGVEDLLRALAPQVLGALVRRHGQFDACEDAVQEALLAAARQWPVDGVPEQPRSWLLTVAGRALVDQWRADSARRRREQAVATLDPAGREPSADQDDRQPAGTALPQPARRPAPGMSCRDQAALRLRSRPSRIRSSPNSNSSPCAGWSRW